jgi:hypothetical protein
MKNNKNNCIKMKPLKLTYSIFLLLFLACNQTDNNKTVTTNDTLANNSTVITENTENQVKEEKLREDVVAGINNIIVLFKNKDVDNISNIISYPLKREYPIPSIKNREEFKLRFSEVFDQNIIDKIVNSKIEQWSEVGSQGIMFDNGDLWITNSEGIITTVNYQSDDEKKLRNNLIEKEKDNLHASLKIFENPIYRIKTETSFIRIDKISKNIFRFASWKKNEKESSKPEIIMGNGVVEYDGSGGNHYITFEDGSTKIKVYRFIMGAEEDTPDVTIEIEKNGITFLTEDGKLVLE